MVLPFVLIVLDCLLPIRPVYLFVLPMYALYLIHFPRYVVCAEYDVIYYFFITIIILVYAKHLIFLQTALAICYLHVYCCLF